MPFITDPEVDRLMGRYGPPGAFGALLCLTCLAPGTPIPIEVLEAALMAFYDEQRVDLNNFLDSLVERLRITRGHDEYRHYVVVAPALIAEADRQIAAIRDDVQRCAIVAAVQHDVDNALIDLVFDYSDDTSREVWERMFIPHLLHRAESLTVLPTLLDLLARYEPSRVAMIAPVFAQALDLVSHEPSIDLTPLIDAQWGLESCCTAIWGCARSEDRLATYAAGRQIMGWIDRQAHRAAGWYMDGHLAFAGLPETTLDEARQICLSILADHGGMVALYQQRPTGAHKAVACLLQRLLTDAPDDPQIDELLGVLARVRMTPLKEASVDANTYALVSLVRAKVALHRGEDQEAERLLARALRIVRSALNDGLIDDYDMADRLLVQVLVCQADLATRRGDHRRAARCYRAALAAVAGGFGDEHMAIQQLRASLQGSQRAAMRDEGKRVDAV